MKWIVLSEGGSEIKEDAAFSFGQSLVPQMPSDMLRYHLGVSWIIVHSYYTIPMF